MWDTPVCPASVSHTIGLTPSDLGSGYFCSGFSLIFEVRLLAKREVILRNFPKIGFNEEQYIFITEKKSGRKSGPQQTTLNVLSCSFPMFCVRIVLVYNLQFDFFYLDIPVVSFFML